MPNCLTFFCSPLGPLHESHVTQFLPTLLLVLSEAWPTPPSFAEYAGHGLDLPVANTSLVTGKDTISTGGGEGKMCKKATNTNMAKTDKEERTLPLKSQNNVLQPFPFEDSKYTMSATRLSDSKIFPKDNISCSLKTNRPINRLQHSCLLPLPIYSRLTCNSAVGCRQKQHRTSEYLAEVVWLWCVEEEDGEQEPLEEVFRKLSPSAMCWLTMQLMDTWTESGSRA